MAFTVSGLVNGRPASVSYDPTLADELKLAGDHPAVARAREAIELEELVALTPTGPVAAAAIRPPWRALVAILSVFDAGPELELAGDVPELPLDFAIPNGATP